MPNPIAHPAVSIPFTKAGMVFSALVIGSLAPDFGYFIPLPSPLFMYTAAGLILFDVPMGFVLLWLFHTLVKWPLLSLLPEPMQRRLFKHAQGFTFGPPKRFGIILLSLLVGSLTHVIWDSFTHVYGWMTEHFAYLSTTIGGTPIYTILQNLSSLIGILVLLYWFIRWLRTAPQGDQLPARFSKGIRTIFFVLAAACLAAIEGAILYSRLISGSHFALGRFHLHSTIFSAVFIISFFTGIYCLAWMIKFHKFVRRAG